MGKNKFQLVLFDNFGFCCSDITRYIHMYVHVPAKLKTFLLLDDTPISILYTVEFTNN